MPKHSQEHTSRNSRDVRFLVILLGILACLLVLVVRPFGYKMFQTGLDEHSVFPVILILGIVGVVLVILQRAGIIFADG